jgi:hypothetical protein
MAKNSLIGKCLTVGIILIFLEICILPSTSQNIEKSYQSTLRGNMLNARESVPGNLPPTFGTPIPVNCSTNNPQNFNWSIPINDPESDAFSWSIKCSNGQTSSGTSALNGTKSLGLTVTNLTTYTIWVNATDPTGSGQYTRKWFTFSTSASMPPSLPVIDGTTSGKVGVSYYYNFVAIDPNGDDVYYRIDWDDGSPITNWIGPYDSGQAMVVSHTFSNTGVLTIKCQAKDSYDLMSNWGTLDVAMPVLYNKPLLIFWEQLFQRYLNAFSLLWHLWG